MATPDHIDLTMDAEQLVTELLKAGGAFEHFSRSAIEVVGVLKKFDKAGDVVGVTIKALANDGSKLVGVFSEIAGAVDATTGVVGKATTDIRTNLKQLTIDQDNAARAARRLAGELKNQIGTKGGFLQTGSRQEQVNILAANDALTQLARTGATTRERIREIFQEFKTGTLQAVEGEGQVRSAVLSVLEAQERLGATERRIAAKTLADSDKKKAAYAEEAALIARVETARAAARGSSTFRAPIPAPSGARAGFAPTEAEQQAFLRAEEGFVRLSAKSKQFAGDAAFALAEARSGLLTLETATSQAEFAAVKLIKAEELLGATAKAAADKTAAAQLKVSNALKDRIALQDRLRGGSTIPGTITATEQEVAAYRRAEEALLRLRATGKATEQQIALGFQLAKAGVLTYKNAVTEAQLGVVALARAEQAFGDTATAAANKAAAALSKKTNASVKALAATRKQIAAEREEAAIRSGVFRKSGLDLRTVSEGGIASKSQVEGFLSAERALARLRGTSKATFTEINTAIISARNNMFTLATATTEVEAAAYKLVAAENAVAAGAKKATAATGGLAASIASLGKLVGISLIIGGAFRLVSAFTEAIDAAAEFSIKIAEIETITKTSAFSTEKWADGLRALSNEFGIDVLKEAEGAYQILSNQIKNAAGETIQGTEALQFLAAANKLAVTGITDTAAATNLLTAATNSFKLPAEDATILAAKLFKTVELGRLRVEDLANILGRVAVPASQLGLSIDEVVGSIDALTIQGFKADEAITAIRNVILKMIKPTKVGQAAIEDLGFATGRALIEAEGFSQGLVSFVEKLGNTIEGTAEGFGRIRAIVGALGLTGENAKITAESIEEIKKAQVGLFDERTQIVLESTGQKLKRIGEQADNLFEKSFGTPATKAIVDLITTLGGIENVITKAVSVFKVLGTTVSFVFGGLLLVKAVTGLNALRLAMAAAATSTLSLGAALQALPWLRIISLTVLAAQAFGEFFIASAAAELKAAEEGNAAVIDRRAKATEEAITLVRQQTAAINDEFKKTTQLELKAIAETQKATFKSARLTAEASKEIGRQLKVSTRSFESSLTARITAVKKLFTTSTSTAKSAATKIEASFAALADQRLGIDLIGAGSGQQVQSLTAAIKQAQREAQAATDAGDLKAFEKASNRVDDLTAQRIDAAIKLSKEELALNQKVATLRLKINQSGNNAERQFLKNRIDLIERQQQLSAQGSKAQAEAQEKLVKLQEKLGDASNEQEFADIFGEISKVRKEQELIEASARREREIRRAALQDQETQIQQLELIRQKNEERAALAEQRQRKLEIAQFLFRSISKEADAFNLKQVLEIKNRDDLLKQVSEQQERIGKIRSLQTLIGGGAEAEAHQRQAALKLEEATRLELQKRAGQAQVQGITEQSEIIQQQIAAAQLLSSTNGSALVAFRTRLGEFAAAISKFQEVGPIEIAADLRDARTIQAEQARTVFGGPSGRLGTTRESEKILGRPDVAATRKNVVEQEKTVKGIRDNVARLEELTKLLQTGPQDQSVINEFNNRFAEFRQTVVDIETRRRSRPGGEPTENISKLDTTVELLLERLTESTPLGAVPQVLKEDQARQQQIASLLAQNRLIDVAIRSKAGEVVETEKVVPAIITFTDLLNNANAALQEREKLANAELVTPDVPGPAALTAPTKLLKEIDEGVAARATDAAKAFNIAAGLGAKDLGRTVGLESVKAADDERQRLASSTARAQAAVGISAENDARIRNAPAIEKRLAAIRVRAQEQAPTPSQVGTSDISKTLPRKQIDTSILLGAGAPSLESQEARITADLAAESERQEAFQRARREAIKTQKAEARQALLASGNVGTNALGQLVSRGTKGATGRGNFDKSGNLTTRGRGNFNEQGQRIGHSTLGIGDNPVEKAILTTAEQHLAATVRTNDILTGKDSSSNTGLPASGTGRVTVGDVATPIPANSGSKSPLGLGVASFTQPGTPESRVSKDVLNQLGRGQNTAEKELAAINKQRAGLEEARNNILEQIREKQLERAALPIGATEWRDVFQQVISGLFDDLARITASTKPILPQSDPANSRDPLIRGLANSARVPRKRGIDVSQVTPFGAVAPQRQRDGETVNNIKIEISGAQDPEAIARAVRDGLQRVQRNIRRGVGLGQ